MQILHYKQKMGCKPISKAITLKKGFDFSKISCDLKVAPRQNAGIDKAGEKVRRQQCTASLRMP
jgi:hypothetical protein